MQGLCRSINGLPQPPASCYCTSPSPGFRAPTVSIGDPSRSRSFEKAYATIVRPMRGQRSGLGLAEQLQEVVVFQRNAGQAKGVRTEAGPGDDRDVEADLRQVR